MLAWGSQKRMVGGLFLFLCTCLAGSFYATYEELAWGQPSSFTRRVPVCRSLNLDCKTWKKPDVARQKCSQSRAGSSCWCLRASCAWRLRNGVCVCVCVLTLFGLIERNGKETDIRCPTHVWRVFHAYRCSDVHRLVRKVSERCATGKQRDTCTVHYIYIYILCINIYTYIYTGGCQD